MGKAVDILKKTGGRLLHQQQFPLTFSFIKVKMMRSQQDYWCDSG